MKIGRLELTGTEAFAAAALMVGVLSHSAFLFNWGNDTLLKTIRWVSLLIFVGSVFLIIHQVNKRLDALREAHQEEVASLADTQERALRGVTESHRMSLAAVRVAQSTVLNADVKQWIDQNPSALHVAASNEIATYLLEDYTASLIERIHRHTREEASRPVYVADYSPIHDLTGRLAENLPAGGVWLGSTLVDDERAWSSADQVLNRFAHATRTRANREEITVLRLYNFGPAGPSRGMRECLAREHANRIRVRYRLGNSARDISLLYAPPAVGGALPPLDAHIIGALREAGCTLLCAVEYDTRGGGALRSATIFAPEHVHTQELLADFDNLWDNAIHYPEQPPPDA